MLSSLITITGSVNCFLLFSLILYELMFRSVLEYLKHHNICFFSIECRKQAKRGQNGCFSTLHTVFRHCMPPNRFQNLYSLYLHHQKYHCKLSHRYVGSLIYDKSLYAEFWGLNSKCGIFCLIVCSNFINTVYTLLNI